MTHPLFARRTAGLGRLVVTLLLVLMAAVTTVVAQQAAREFPLAAGPWTFETHEPGTRIRVSVVTRGLSHPWSLAFLPDGSMLVTERAGRLRVIRDGVLDPEPVPGLPRVHANWLAGLMDIALHPRFTENRLLYLTYSKPGERNATTALARGRYEDGRLADVQEIFEADAWAAGNGSFGSRVVFGADGMLYMTVGHRAQPTRAQDLSQHAGTILRLRDDGTVPPDNPFVGREGVRPEIFSYGHRNQQGLAVHPETGALWANEQGPNGGDEINIILPGRNYGWPIVTYGREYNGAVASDRPWREGMEQPHVFWVPQISVSGMAFYTGDRFPAWKGNAFVGGMMTGRIPGTGHLERIVFNDQGELRRESLLTELKQRIRDVRQGPDGLLYILTEEEDGALLKIEPVGGATPSASSARQSR
jgi:glucose/arabinose dehydrogenase